MSNLSWSITAVSHLVSLIYNIILFMKHGSPDEPMTVKMSAIIIKMLVCVVYLWLAYFTDHQKKINFVINHNLQ